MRERVLGCGSGWWGGVGGVVWALWVRTCVGGGVGGGGGGGGGAATSTSFWPHFSRGSISISSVHRTRAVWRALLSDHVYRMRFWCVSSDDVCPMHNASSGRYYGHVAQASEVSASTDRWEVH